MRIYAPVIALSLAALAGCSSTARSTVYQGENIAPAARLPASEVMSDKHVLMIDGSLPDGILAKPLGEVRVNAGRMSSVARMYGELALRGRYVGADAVVNINYKIQVAPFVTGAPSISGVAVQIQPMNADALAALDGKVVAAAQEWLAGSLKDFDSAKLRNTHFSNAAIPVICGEVNAKNSMGGYTGFKRFYYGGADEVAAVEGEVTSGAFAMRYENLCNGKRREVPLLTSMPKSHESVADELHKLHLLMERGVISKEEFDRQKSRLLN